MAFEGFFEIKNARDLLDKLDHDLLRLMKNPLDQYTAFDFFVTAEHMLDWVYPGKANKEKRKQMRESNVLLALCSHLANGSKHFKVEHKHHTSVVKTSAHRGAFQSNAFQADAFQTLSALVVYLENEAAKEYGDSILVLELAQKVRNFWKNNVP